jgi:hypothetical protein
LAKPGRGTVAIVPNQGGSKVKGKRAVGAYAEYGLSNASSTLSDAEKRQRRQRYQELKRQNRSVSIGRGRPVRFARGAGGLFWKNYPGNCSPVGQTYLGNRRKQAGQLGVLDKNEGRWICKAPIGFREQVLGSRECDYRIFADGVEVSAYVRGPVNFTYETTGGMNTCSFELNNNQDAFIVTYLNICSDLSPHGWRISTQSSLPTVAHSEPRYDELAKYLLYRKKFKRVNPGSRNAEIDPETGMWLHPLNPDDAIFDKHDPVRVFKRLSHIDGVPVKAKTGTKIRAYYDLWMAVFTGFIRTYNWNDDYVSADRSMSIECVDYRGLMEGMRVRVAGIPLKSSQKAGQSKKRDDFITKTMGYATKGASLAKRQAAQAVANARAHLILGKLQTLYNLKKRNNVLGCRLSNTGTTNQKVLNCVNGANVNAQGQVRPLVLKARQLELKLVDYAARIETWSGEKVKFNVTEDDITVEYQKVQTTKPPQVTQNKTSQSETPSDAKGGPPVKQGSTKGSDWGGSNKPVLNVDVQYWQTNFYQEASSAQQVIKQLVPKPQNAAGEIDLLHALKDYLLNARDIVYKPSSQLANIASGGQTMAEFNEQQLARSKPVTSGAVGADALIKEFKKAVRVATLIHQRVVGFVAAKLRNDTKALLAQIKLLQGNGYPVAIDADNRKKLAAALQGPISALTSRVNTAKTEINKILKQLRDLSQQLDKQITQEKRKFERQIGNQGLTVDQGVSKFANIIKAYNEVRRQGGDKLDPRVKTAGNLAELIVNEPTFSKRQAGLFADLVRAVDQNDHPLAGMSYEEAAVWLCCANSLCLPATLLELGSYGSRGKTPLQEWNKTVLFGVIGRPLTYKEVTLAGQLSTADLESPLSPYRPLLHMLLPASGTGVRTIVQQDITANTGNSTSFEYVTRKSLLDEISHLINYQVFCNGWGDMVFEFPHYNASPEDFGKTFEGAYILDKEITGLTINPESSDLYTAWVISGLEPQKVAQNGNLVVQNLFYKVSIIAPILARRLGVRVEHMQLQIPGVGAQIGSTKQPAGGQDSLLAYGLLHIQRQLGEAYKVTIKEIPDRPYLLPNRPIWIVPRSKICLTESVSYTMDKPNGATTCSVNTGFTRWMFRDGSFRTVLGGRSVIDYASIYTGTVYQIKEGVGNVRGRQNDSTRNARKGQSSNAPVSCAPGLKKAYIRSAYHGGDAVGSQATQWHALGGDTVGLDGSAAMGTPSTVFGFGKYGHRPFKLARNPGKKENGLGDPKKAGLVVEGTKKEDKPDVYQLTNIFYNPYPFGEGFNKGNPNYNTWGFLRYNNKHAWNKICTQQMQKKGLCKGTRGNIEVPWHSGIDINIKTGTPIKTPIDLDNMNCFVDVGPGPGKYRNPTTWVEYQRIGVTTVINNVPQYGFIDTEEGKDAIKFATNPKNPKTKIVGEDARAVKYVAVYKRQYKRWKASKEKGKKPYGIRRGNGHRGVRLSGYGYVTAPKTPAGSGLQGKRLRCHLAFVHNDEVLGEKRGKNFEYYGVGISKVSAGTTVAKVGNVGTNPSNPHLHLEMGIVHPEKSKNSDEQLFQEVLRANNEYLTTQLVLRFSGGNPKSNQLSDYWKNRFKARKLKITNVREAVEYSLRRSQTIKKFVNPDPRSLLFTNPLFFFKPTELVPASSKYKDAQTYKGTYHSSQGLFENLGSFEDNGTPICGKLKEIDKAKVKTKYMKCVLEARKTATSNYRQTSRKLFLCRKNARTQSRELADKARQKRSSDKSQGNPKVAQRARKAARDAAKERRGATS